MGNDIAPVLVTGAAGYLGAHVLANLKRKQMSSVGADRYDCDLTNRDDVYELLNRVRPSAIIHCAAVVPKSASAYDDNDAVEASITMMKVIAQYADCPVVFASSMTVYTGVEDFPVREDIPLSPPPGYARGKLLAEQILFERNCMGDVALRLPGLFGLPRRSGLLYNAAKAFLSHGKFEPAPSSGIWAAMAVQDAAEYMVLAAAVASAGYAPQPINIGYEGDFSVLIAVSEIAAQCGQLLDLTSMEQPFSMCLERLKQRYGLLPATFQQRLEELVAVARCDLKAESLSVFNA